MSKYINAEELENLVQQEIDECKEELATANYELTKGLTYAMDGANRVVTIAKNMPNIEIVRCKDCKFWEYTCQGDFDFGYGDCLFWQIEHCSDFYMETTGNHYCGFAKERKESE